MVRDCPSKRRHQHFMLANMLSSNNFSIAVIAMAALASMLVASPLRAQQRPHHYFQRADMPPGSIGRAQLLRGGPLPGYFQPVEVRGPQGTRIAMATDGVFEPPQASPLKAGMLIGSVYRLKVTNIPFHEGQEVFPSIEVVNRLFPPPGFETKFPIPIELTREEIEMALRGQFVIRVIYLENPRTALPRREDPVHQRYFEVGPSQDPLEVADTLGRPMAILRIGSRVPELDATSGRFLFASPPWLRFPTVVDDAAHQPTDAPALTTPPTAPAAVPAPPVPPQAVPQDATPPSTTPTDNQAATDRVRRRAFLPTLPPATAQRPLPGVGVIR